VYIVVLNVLYDDVYMYKSLQIKFLFCSVLYKDQFLIVFGLVSLAELYCK